MTALPSQTQLVVIKLLHPGFIVFELVIVVSLELEIPYKSLIRLMHRFCLFSHDVHGTHICR